MTKKKKIIMIVILIILAVELLGLMFSGYQWSWGPFAGLSKLRFGSMPGNSSEYAIENVAVLENSPLQGMHICYLGSSVTKGASSLDTSFAEYIAKRNGTTYVKEAVSGTTLVESGDSSYIARMKKLNENEHFDLLVCQLSTNDATQNKPLGAVTPEGTTGFDTATICGAMEYIITYAQDTWGCPVVFYTNSYYENPEYAAMVDTLYLLQEKYGIGIIDLYTDEAFNQIGQEQYALYMADSIHPTKAGYLQWWVPQMEAVLCEYLAK